MNLNAPPNNYKPDVKNIILVEIRAKSIIIFKVVPKILTDLLSILIMLFIYFLFI
jgi:hypothetical protein